MSYITIYFEDKPVYLTNDVNNIKLNRGTLKEDEDVVYMEGTSNFDLQKMPKEIQKPQYKRGIIYNDDLESLVQCFFEQFVLVKAAGGLVKNEKGDFLFIFRRGKWDLPKGKLDEGETPETGALREVAEETGLQQLSISSPLAITYHTYLEAGTLILKETHWFEMLAPTEQILIPQQEEEITEVKWIPKTDVLDYYDKCYPAIGDILKLAMGR